MDPTTAAAWLKRFGYSAVSDFQRQAGLDAGNSLDDRTTRAMLQPRCGVSENAQRAAAGAGPRDPGRDYQADPIIYSIGAQLPGLTAPQFLAEFAAAFSAWSAICGVAGRLARPGERAELQVDVRTRRQDRELDGPGRTLAYAVIGGGLMVFDGDEQWVPTGSTRPGIVVANVACHELGHILNFYHSQLPGALMAPVYNPAVAVPQSPDDVQRAQAAYGPAPTTTPPPTTDLEGFSGRLTFANGRLLRVE